MMMMMMVVIVAYLISFIASLLGEYTDLFLFVILIF